MTPERDTAYQLFALALQNENLPVEDHFRNPPQETRKNFNPAAPGNLIKFDDFWQRIPHPNFIPNHYFEIPRRERLKYVLYMIGHVMLKYGTGQERPRPNFVFFKVDSLLYEVGLDQRSKKGNLYTRSIGCFYGNQQIDQWILDEQDCRRISQTQENDRYWYRRSISDEYNCLSYPQMAELSRKWPGHRATRATHQEQINLEKNAPLYKTS